MATYFLALRSTPLHKAAKEIAYHATSGIKDPPPGSLLAQCTAHAAGVDAWDASGRLGLLHMAFPLKMLRQPDGHLTSCDLLHTAAGAIIFDVYENQDARLVGLHLPDDVLSAFPGPAYGPQGIAPADEFRPGQARLRHHPQADGRHHAQRSGRPCGRGRRMPVVPVRQGGRGSLSAPGLFAGEPARARRPVAAIHRAKEKRQGKGLLFAPHITGAPHEMRDTLSNVLVLGATAVMFSETFAGGTVRMVRDVTRHHPNPPAIYGHNAGIGVKTRGGIWREVIDLLARLDGIDFRQTAPIRPGTPFLRPYGDEWQASEEILSREIPGIKPTMIVRAGGLDQGNIIPNLVDAERRGLASNILFLAGSAINSIKNSKGQVEPRLGAEAMRQASGSPSLRRVGRRVPGRTCGGSRRPGSPAPPVRPGASTAATIPGGDFLKKDPCNHERNYCP